MDAKWVSREQSQDQQRQRLSMRQQLHSLAQMWVKPILGDLQVAVVEAVEVVLWETLKVFFGLEIEGLEQEEA